MKDAAWLAEQFERHRRQIRMVAVRNLRDKSLADDVAQDAFTALCEHADRLLPESEIGAWLSVVARNRAISVNRTGSRIQCGEMPEPTSPAIAEARAEIGSIMAQIPQEAQQLLWQRFALNASIGDIADSLGLKQATIRSRLRRALEALRCPPPPNKCGAGGPKPKKISPAPRIKSAPYCVLITDAATDTMCFAARKGWSTLT